MTQTLNILTLFWGGDFFSGTKCSCVKRDEFLHYPLQRTFSKWRQFFFCPTSVLTFTHHASCILGQAFRYSPENAFYMFNQQIYFIIWYFLIKYIKSVLWRGAKCLSYIEEARCLKVNIHVVFLCYLHTLILIILSAWICRWLCALLLKQMGSTCIIACRES